MKRTSRDEPSLVIRGDPSLRPIEKETSLNLLGGGEFWDVQSFHPTAVRGLLAQSEFEVTGLYTCDVGGEEAIVGVRGRLPLASLKIGRPRKDGRLSRTFGRRCERRDRPTAVCLSDTPRVGPGSSEA